ncbi:MAG: Cof-type HAD-IIB family hydrolase [Flavobacteriales bacterium]|nr:Cof-type HAD-IIB family hydrolase [Flavobacteriales bacterium]
MIKAVFFDIDGTLVSFKTHEVPQSTHTAIKALHKKGIRTFIASGRRKADIDLVPLPPMDGYVSLNGSVCLDGEGSLLYKIEIPKSDVERVIDLLKTDKKAFPCALVTDEGMFLDRDGERIAEFYKTVKVPPPAMISTEKWAEIARKGISQMLGFFTPEKEKEIMKKVLPNCKALRWVDIFADIVPAYASKSAGISHICDIYGIKTEETMAFGDGGNDIDMLSHVGTGIAMGQAADEVKNAANYTTSSVDQDGILNALLHLGVLTKEDLTI